MPVLATYTYIPNAIEIFFYGQIKPRNGDSFSFRKSSFDLASDQSKSTCIENGDIFYSGENGRRVHHKPKGKPKGKPSWVYLLTRLKCIQKEDTVMVEVGLR